MLIRSQDKKKLMNLSKLIHFQIDEKSGKYNISAEYCKEDGYQYIGEYSTEAKAIKVLDMICGKTKQPNNEILYDINGRVIYFQMPLESEVDG